jgi:hypothetical protein
MLQMSASRTTSISTLMVLLRLSVKQLPYIAASKFQFVEANDFIPANNFESSKLLIHSLS